MFQIPQAHAQFLNNNDINIEIILSFDSLNYLAALYAILYTYRVAILPP
jgi:hypothetical protein